MKIYKLSAVLLMLLGGCTPKVAEWTPAESPKENKVDRAVFSHTVHYPAHAKSMGEREKKNLHQFLRRNVLHPSGVTVILEEYGGHSEKRIKDIERELLKFGIPFDLITTEYEPEEYSRKHHGKVSGSGVEIIIEHYVVIPPSCANFSQTLGNARQEYASSNFGCADTANFGMMVANPRDLIIGRSLGASDGTVIAAGVNRYRKDKVKSLMDTSTTVEPANLNLTTTTSSSGTSSSGGAY